MAYERGGNVVSVVESPAGVVALVQGSRPQPYRVELTTDGPFVDAECVCPAFDDEGTCKHVVAVVLTIQQRTQKRSKIEPRVYSATERWEYVRIQELAPRLGGEVTKSAYGWNTVGEYRRRLRAPERARFDAALETLDRTVQRELEALAAYEPPAFDRAHALAVLVAAAHQAFREALHVFTTRPPTDALPKVGAGIVTLHKRELVIALKPRLRVSFTLPDAPSDGAWQHAFALVAMQDPLGALVFRELLHALGTDESLAMSLQKELTRAPWERALAMLEAQSGKARPRGELALVFEHTHEAGYRYRPVGRTERKRDSGFTKWAPVSGDALHRDDVEYPDGARELVASVATEDAYANMSHVSFATASGFHFAKRLEASGVPSLRAKELTPFAVRTGDVLLAFEHSEGETEFRVQFSLLGALLDESSMNDIARGSSHVARLDADGIVVGCVSAPVARWLRISRSVGAELRFPREAFGRLAGPARELLRAGIKDLPAEVLGTELALDLRPALAVEY